jgi:hypothetical protein
MLKEKTIRRKLRLLELICWDRNATICVRQRAADRCRLLNWVLGDSKECPVKYLESLIAKRKP